jgi:predicted transcriptional regulator
MHEIVELKYILKLKVFPSYRLISIFVLSFKLVCTKMNQKVRLTTRLGIKSDGDEQYARIERALSTLANRDALKIFQMAKEGISSSTDAMKKLNITQKRYYMRLGDLIKANLIQKDDGVYKHTTLGSLFYEVIKLLGQAVDKQEQLELIDKIKRSKNLSAEEKDEIIYALAKGGIDKFINLIDGGINPIGIVYKFEDIVEGTIKLIESAENEVYIASRYTENSIVEAIFRNLNRGIKWHLLSGDKNNLSQKIRMLSTLLSHPRMIKIYYDIFRSENVRTGYVENLPFSFIIVDGRYVGIEIPKPEGEGFFAGFFLENKVFAEKLIEIFNLLMARAKEDPRKEASRKYVGRAPQEIFEDMK